MPDDASVVDAERRGAPAFADVDVGMRRDVGAELAQDPPARRAPARVRDAAARVASLQPEREVAVAVGVEGDAEPLEVAEARGRLLDQDARRGGADDPAAGGDRVLEMLLRRVVGGERGREPALGPVRRGLGQRARGDQRDPGALARGGQRGVEPGRAGAHDDEVGPVHGEEPVRYPRVPDRLAAPPALARPRGATAPGAAGADHRAGGGDGAPRLVRVRRRARAGRDARAAARCAPGRAHRLHRGAVRLRRRADRLRHGRDARDLRGGGAGGGGRCRAGG